MSDTIPARADALALLHEYTASDSLRKHMLAVEAAMRAYAGKWSEDAERWGLAGLMHDFDYEKWPNASHAADAEHPAEGVRLLRSRGYPEDVLQAILGHATYTGVKRESRMAKALFAVDELTGLITAAALVRPSKSVLAFSRIYMLSGMLLICALPVLLLFKTGKGRASRAMDAH